MLQGTPGWGLSDMPPRIILLTMLQGRYPHTHFTAVKTEPAGGLTSYLRTLGRHLVKNQPDPKRGLVFVLSSWEVIS